MLLSAGFMIVFGVFTKFGALFVTIPDPVIAGTFFILFGETDVFTDLLVLARPAI